MFKFIFIFTIILQLNLISSPNGVNLNKYISEDSSSLNNYKTKNINQINILESRIPIGRIILFLILALALFIIYTSIRNTITLNKFIEEIFAIVKKNYKLEEIDIGDLKKIRVKNILVFYSKVYYIPGFGYLSIMTVNLGIMQMITFNVNPFEKDLPQFINDIIFLFGKRTVLIEFYDSMLDKKNNKYINFLNKIKEIHKKYSDLEFCKTKENWSDSILSECIKKTGTVKHWNRMTIMFNELLEIYLEYAKEASELNEDEKEKKILIIKGICDTFIEKGGIAVNTFKSSVGAEKTAEVLGKIIYSYLLYKDLNIKKDQKVKNE